VSRVIRNPRAQELQGKRAGIVTRAIADIIDYGIAFLIYVAFVAAIGVAWDLFFSSTVHVERPPASVSGLGIFFVFFVYLGLGWGSTGRTAGKQLMGLRVVRRDARALTGPAAFGRAFLCAIFFPGLLLALLHRRNQSLQDLICKTAVVYDWIPESTRPRRFAPAVHSHEASA
jgi:uncharacterized RDD family membrane protein YckC